MRAAARTRLAASARLAALVLGVAALSGCTSTAARSGSALVVTGHTLTVYLSVPPGIGSDRAEQDLLGAEQLACTRDRGEVTAFAVSCRRVQTGELSANARHAIQDSSAIAFVGEAAPGSSQDSAGITNALDLLQISPSDGSLEMTRPTPAVAGAPSRYYQSWASYGRTFAHVVPSTAQEASALVAAIRAGGATSLYVAHDASGYGASIAAAVLADAGSGLRIIDRESAAGAIFFGAASPATGARFMNGAALLAPTARLYGPAALDAPPFVSLLSPAAARAVRISSPGFVRPPPGARRSFVLPFIQAYGHAPAPSAIYGFAAVDALFSVLRAAGSHANNRATVVRDFLELNDPTSVLGHLTIKPDGDTTPASFVIKQVRNGRLVVSAGTP